MTTITYREILNSNCSLAPSQLNTLDIPNQNTLFVKKLLDRKLEFSDRGKEVGSINYIFQSTHHFIRTKGLQEDYFSPFLNSETVVAIRPQVFEDFNLKEGDLIISKDANIGEAVILDQDYPNFTISSALYKLPISKNKFYLLAFLKHHYFRNQLNLLVPKGSTIRHAKTLFLDCKIPFPNQENTNEITSYVELLTRVIINKEKIIKKKNQLIFELIEKEILENQKKGEFGNESPKFSELFSNSRLDSGYYCYDYKQKQFLISNYKYGAEVIENWGFVMRRGQNFPIKQTRKIIYSDQLQKDFYELIVPTNISEFGTVKKSKYLGTLKSYPCLRMGDIVFSIDGTIGKCIIFIDSKKKTITTGHSMILSKTKCNIEESVFVSCFLRFLRHWDVLDYISAGGQGGALGKKYWKDIMISKFSKSKQKEISLLYYNPTIYPNGLNLENFLEKDQTWNEKAGIIELDKSVKQMKKYLNKTLDKIINDEKVEISFNEFKNDSFREN